MAKYIVIDGGTTNTRVGLMNGGALCGIKKLRVGAGSEDKDKYKAEIKNAVTEFVNENDDIECIIGAGMLTSEFGIYNIPHISAPAGVCELSEGMKRVNLPEISSLPFCLVSGVKTVGTLEKSDMMRGEECEVFGLCDKFSDALYVLPGSHSKLIKVEDGKITDFSTALTGEMVAALSGSTILRDAVDLKTEGFDSEYLKKGYFYAKENGINEALFKVRILKNLFAESNVRVYSFFLGAVLAGEIDAILSKDAKRIVIAGKRELREPTAELLCALTDSEIITADEKTVEQSTFCGMVKIYENKKQMQ